MTPFVPIGSIKTFGLGPKYQVERALRRLDDGDVMVEIVLVETGEVTEYRLSSIMRHPDAR